MWAAADCWGLSVERSACFTVGHQFGVRLAGTSLGKSFLGKLLRHLFDLIIGSSLDGGAALCGFNLLKLIDLFSGEGDPGLHRHDLLGNGE